MSYFRIQGGNSLKGNVVPQGSKNEAMQILCAVLLSKGKVRVKNIPNIKDVNLIIEIITGIGVSKAFNAKGDYTFQVDKINTDYIKSKEFFEKSSKIRGSIMILAPILSLICSVSICHPGGDKIGRRKIDTHIDSLRKMGVKFHHDIRNNKYNFKVDKLKGAYIIMDEPSVTGTANVIMAAVLAQGNTTIYNAACELYIQQLCKMLNKMGAKIKGIGTNLINIQGVDELGGCEHHIMPDIIEIGSWIGLAAMTNSYINVKNANTIDLGIIPTVFENIGIKVKKQDSDIIIEPNQAYEIKTYLDGSIMSISDAPWPGLTPDLLSIILVVATKAKGNLLIHQKMFESRLFFTDRLIDMGAKILLCDPHRAIVIGSSGDNLMPTNMSSPDIRAGMSLVIAALSADGVSKIENIEQIQRGYEDLELKLTSLGADIVKV